MQCAVLTCIYNSHLLLESSVKLKHLDYVLENLIDICNSVSCDSLHMLKLFCNGITLFIQYLNFRAAFKPKYQCCCPCRFHKWDLQ